MQQQDTQAADQQQKALTIAEYNPTQAALGELRKLYENVIFPVETTKGMKDAKEVRQKFVKLRTALEAKRKEIKEPALRRAQAIDSEARELTAAIKALEEPIDSQIKAEETRKEREKEERERIERERVAAIQAKITKIRQLPGESIQDTADQLRATINDLDAFEITEADFAEFAGEAAHAKAGALDTLNGMLARAEANEKEAARLAAERAAQEAEARRMAEQRAELERQQQEIARQRAELEAASKPKEGGWLAEMLKPEDAPPVDLFAGAGVDESGAQVVITCAPDASPAVRAFVDMGSGDETVIAMARRSGSVIEIVDAPAMPPEDVAPTGYWCNGEYWGTTPDGDGKAAEFIGQELKLTPFWTHGRDVTFVVSDDGSGTAKAIMRPATPEDAADLFRSSLDA